MVRCFCFFVRGVNGTERSRAALASECTYMRTNTHTYGFAAGCGAVREIQVLEEPTDRYTERNRKKSVCEKNVNIKFFIHFYSFWVKFGVFSVQEYIGRSVCGARPLISVPFGEVTSRRNVSARRN